MGTCLRLCGAGFTLPASAEGESPVSHGGASSEVLRTGSRLWVPLWLWLVTDLDRKRSSVGQRLGEYLAHCKVHRSASISSNRLILVHHAQAGEKSPNPS
ncbi:unnamed protein product [Eretmochelys imbricata]